MLFIHELPISLNKWTTRSIISLHETCRSIWCELKCKYWSVCAGFWNTCVVTAPSVWTEMGNGRNVYVAVTSIITNVLFSQSDCHRYYAVFTRTALCYCGTWCHRVSVRPSVGPSICLTPVMCQTKLRDSPGTLIVFWCQQLLMGDNPIHLKFALKVIHLPSNTTISTNICSQCLSRDS